MSKQKMGGCKKKRRSNKISSGVRAKRAEKGIQGPKRTYGCSMVRLEHQLRALERKNRDNDLRQDHEQRRKQLSSKKRKQYYG